MASRRVLLTGANGFVGSHILDQLLKASFSVRAVLRSQSKIDAVKADFPGSSLDFAVVPDMTAAGAFDEALKSSPPFDTVIHTASPFLYKVVKDNHDFLDPAIKGTTEILKGIKRVAPEVKRVIITSSFAAIGAFGQYNDANKTYTSDDWNPVTLETALSSTNKSTAYQVSKKLAEMAAWNFIKEEKPNFDLVTINPPAIYGPLRHTVNNPSELNESSARIYNLFINSSASAELPPNALHLYVDVRDVAKAHVESALRPEAGNTRFLLTAGGVSSQQISDVLRENVKELENRTPAGKPGSKGLPDDAFKADSSPAKEVLGIDFVDAKSTFVDFAKQMLEVEKRQNA